MDANCDVFCPQLRTQSIAQANQCRQQQKVRENIDGWLDSLPGNMEITGPQPAVGGGGNGGGNPTPTQPSQPGTPTNGGGNSGCTVARWYVESNLGIILVVVLW